MAESELNETESTEAPIEAASARPQARPADVREGGRREMLRVWGPVAVLGALAVAYTLYRLEPPAPDRLTIAAGSPEGAYSAFAGAYRQRLAEDGLELVLVHTAGAVDNLRRLEAGEVDLAILQGGVVDAGDRRSDGLQSLASLFFEPVWVFFRDDPERPVGRLTDLAGCRVAIGPEGSGTRTVARQLLDANGFSLGEGGAPITTLDLGFDEAAAALRAGEVDAAFFVASASAGYVRDLLAAPGIELLSFRRHRAYSYLHPYLSQVVLGEGVLDLEANLPPRDIDLLAAAATLGARDDVHHALVPLLVQTLQDVHGRGGLFEEPGTFPSARFTELPMNTEAAHHLAHGPSFLFRILPYRTAASVDRLKILLLPFLPLLLVVFKMAPPLYRWRIRSKIYRWYEDLREIDRFLLGDPEPEQVGQYLETVRRLDRELTEEVSVPLSYMDEFYDLRVHIGLIQAKLAELAQVPPDDPRSRIARNHTRRDA